MGEYIERLWHPDDTAGLSRKDRAPGRYRAYVPDELGRDLPALGGEPQAAAEEAVTVLARADERIGSRGRYLNHLLIRSESISSSWIEGNRITPKKLAIAEVLHQGSRVALDVVANVRATEEAIADLADGDRPITTADIEHLQHVIEPRLEPGLRKKQNWVGGPGWSPLRATFVPPPENEVPRRLICWTADRHLALVALTERSNRVGGGDTQGRKVQLAPPRPGALSRRGRPTCSEVAFSGEHE